MRSILLGKLSGFMTSRSYEAPDYRLNGVRIVNILAPHKSLFNSA